jgi:hypothetical protein
MEHRTESVDQFKQNPTSEVPSTSAPHIPDYTRSNAPQVEQTFLSSAQVQNCDAKKVTFL